MLDSAKKHITTASHDHMLFKGSSVHDVNNMEHNQVYSRKIFKLFEYAFLIQLEQMRVDQNCTFEQFEVTW